MKKRELQEIKSESAEKLMERVVSMKREMLKASMPSLGNVEKNLKIRKNLRKSVAQILTIIKANKQK